MEFYEAWDLAEDEQLREDLQRTLKRSRSCSPTSPVESEDAQDLPAPDAEEDRASETTQSPSVVMEAPVIEEDHAERHGQAEPQEDNTNKGEKIPTPNGEPIRRDDAFYEDW